MRASFITRAVRLSTNRGAGYPSRSFSTANRLKVVKPFYLADIGEGIRECEVIQWFVQPGAHIEEFDKICEVQSDKASVDIPSRFSGVIKKLHYEAGEMAIVGKPLIDIDVQEEAPEEEESTPSTPSGDKRSDSTDQSSDITVRKDNIEHAGKGSLAGLKKKGTHASLATPAVRHLSKELDVDIDDIDGTGRDGRVTKEDIYKFQSAKSSTTESQAPAPSSNNQVSTPSINPPSSAGEQKETPQALTQTQLQMFKTMTRSLTIPHFTYTDDLNLTALARIRKKINGSRQPAQKLSYMPFFIKALSLTLHQFPLLNARAQLDGTTQKPGMIYRSQHNVGIAMDTPSGLIVPVIHNVAALSIGEIAAQLSRLQSLASTSSLSPSDLSGGTITISNIGSIGGMYMSPVLVDSQVAIIAVGKIRPVPGYGEDGELKRMEMGALSWSADHRVVDGASVARAAEVVKGFLESVESMVLELR